MDIRVADNMFFLTIRFPLMPPELVENADLLLLLALGEDARADGQDGEAEPHIEHFGHDVAIFFVFHLLSIVLLAALFTPKNRLVHNRRTTRNASILSRMCLRSWHFMLMTSMLALTDSNCARSCRQSWWRMPICSSEAASLREAIQFYDANIKTGNEVLDVVLCEKAMTCQKDGRQKRWPSPDSISLDRSGAMPASPGR